MFITKLLIVVLLGSSVPTDAPGTLVTIEGRVESGHIYWVYWLGNAPEVTRRLAFWAALISDILLISGCLEITKGLLPFFFFFFTYFLFLEVLSLSRNVLLR